MSSPRLRGNHDSAHFDARDYRHALGQYPTGITVITARGPDGRKIGLTANSFTSVSLDPPLISWCPSKKASDLLELENAAYFAVNVLAADQHHLSSQFATPAQEAQDKFEGVAITEGIGGLPLIEGAVAHFQCHTVRWVDAGDHAIVLGEVEQYDIDGGEPLVFHSGRYRVVTTHPAL
jgi:flavin reductase (DIM6/NTAB) family NADH-FMN oxidoreductase RutF